MFPDLNQVSLAFWTMYPCDTTSVDSLQEVLSLIGLGLPLTVWTPLVCIPFCGTYAESHCWTLALLYKDMEPRSGSEAIGTKPFSQSLIERLPAPIKHVHDLAHDLASLPAPLLSFSSEGEGPAFALMLPGHTVALECTRVLQPVVAVPQNQPFDLDMVLAGSGTTEIPTSIESDHCHKPTRILGLNSSQIKHKYSWWIHFLTPITHLPLELLQQILLIVIDEMSDPLSVLMHMCKYWHTVVTSIWASLKLRTKMTKDDVI